MAMSSKVCSSALAHVSRVHADQPHRHVTQEACGALGNPAFGDVLEYAEAPLVFKGGTLQYRAAAGSWYNSNVWATPETATSHLFYPLLLGTGQTSGWSYPALLVLTPVIRS
jgi:hypothetical protein